MFNIHAIDLLIIICCIVANPDPPPKDEGARNVTQGMYEKTLTHILSLFNICFKDKHYTFCWNGKLSDEFHVKYLFRKYK